MPVDEMNSRRTRRSNAGVPPIRYSPSNIVDEQNSNKSKAVRSLSNRKEEMSQKSKTETSYSAQKIKEIDLRKLEEINKLQREYDLRELERQKEFDRQELERKLSELEIQAAIEKDKITEGSLESRSISSKSNKSAAAIPMDELPCAHDRVKWWLEDERSSQVSKPVQDMYDRRSSRNKLPEPLPSVAGQLTKEFTVATQVITNEFLNVTRTMTNAFRSVSENNPTENCTRMSIRSVIGKDLPTFGGNVEEWPMFFTLFKRSTETCHFTEEENMVRLQKALRYEALDSVKALFVSPNNLQCILDTLERRFGRPEFIIESMMNKVRQLPPVNSRYPITLIKFANSVQNLTVTAQSLEMEAYINNPQLISTLVLKLPEHMQFQWAREVRKLNNCIMPTLVEFSVWLQEESSAASILCKPSTSSSNEKYEKRNKNVVFLGSEGNAREIQCKFCSKSNHLIYKCRQFLDLAVDRRWEWVKEHKICFSCLVGSHQVFKCKNKQRCRVDDCKKYHNRLLHANIPENRNFCQDVEMSLNQNENGISNSQETTDSSFLMDEHSLQVETRSRSVLLRILPVTLIGSKKSVKVYALFDEGSTVSLIDSKLAEEVGVEGYLDPLKIFWTNSTSFCDNKSKRLTLKIQGTLTSDIHELSNVRTMSNLNLPTQTVNIPNICSKWTHLLNIPLVNLKEAKPLLLIGQDNIDLTIAREVIQGSANAPVASRTKLGWVVHGNLPYLKYRIEPQYSMFCHYKGKDEKDDLDDLIRQCIVVDNMGATSENQILLSEDDRRGLSIMEKTSKQLENGHWEIGLLWKENVNLPESRKAALRRLYTIEKRMDKDVMFAEKYCNQMDSFLKKGYARILTPEEVAITTAKTWYLPHFSVNHPNKPEKFRFVFDAKAKVEEKSLNQHLYRGPDLLNSLINILFNFRHNPIAVLGDIEEMFLQIRIKTDDQCAQRFLWRGKDKDAPILTYQMNVMIFGTICSPSCANFILNKNANKYEEEYPESVKAVRDYHYMDDYLDSFASEEVAVRRVTEIIKIHKYGGFNMRGWLSNSPKVMKHIPETLHSKKITLIDLEKWQLPTYEKTLGINWEPQNDFLSFSNKFLDNFKDILAKENVPTKRQVIRIVMSIYDPLGFLAAFTIQARILMQEVWSQKIEWDEKLSPKLFEKWCLWVVSLHKIQSLTIPRWYRIEFSSSVEIQLHIFNDGSEKGYASVSYFRIMSKEGDISTVFVMAKSRVTSLKPMTIPKIELQSALLGARLSKTIESGHNFKISKKFFWTDSKIVLSWIKSNPRNYKIFVANRISEILDLTEPTDWYWIPSKLNMADDATRGLWDIGNFETWLQGPKFLTTDETKWHLHNDQYELDTVVERKNIMLFVLSEDVKVFEFSRFSNYLRLVRSAAWVLKFVKACKIKIGKIVVPNFSRQLTVEEFEEAEVTLFNQAQKETFLEEMEQLSRNKNIKKSSRIYKLNPFIDAQGILKLSGRLDYAQHLQMPMRQPIILDPKHLMTVLLIRHYHKINHHQGREHVLSHLREKFWIINGRNAVKNCQNSCVVCIRKNARLEVQQMGQMPDFRVTPQVRAFMVTGMDYFGPMLVSIGRRREKRYGVIFTCMSTRAIHLELASSLTTDSAIMSIRRFICRRGYPSEIYSDNGTNLCGADKEMKKAILEINPQAVQDFCCNKHIKWKRNAPGASHAGGVWERLIRSVKDTLRTILKEQCPKEEMLQTLLVEIEHTVNSRPLTIVSSDHQDDEALTPNHFLIGPSNFVGSPGKFTDSEIHLRKQWRIAQTFADSFWKRWVKEWIPTLVKRSKWQHNISNVAEGDLVILADESFPRNTWPIGRITKMYPGRDGKVRVVNVKTSLGEYRRPITKLILLKKSSSISGGPENVSD